MQIKSLKQEAETLEIDESRKAYIEYIAKAPRRQSGVSEMMLSFRDV